MSDSEWKHELTVNGWRQGDGVTIGIDLDGDIGLIDQSGNSIIIRGDEMRRLHKWLGERIQERDAKEQTP